MPAPFKIIGIYGRVKSPGVAETLNDLVAFLKQHQYELLVETETATALVDTSLPVVSTS